MTSSRRKPVARLFAAFKSLFNLISPSLARRRPLAVSLLTLTLFAACGGPPLDESLDSELLENEAEVEELGSTSQQLATTLTTAAELVALANDPARWSGSYTLGADIDLASVPFPGIGDDATPFRGLFNGNGRKISNLRVEASGRGGLFGTLWGGRVANLTLENPRVYFMGAGAGALARKAGGGARITGVRVIGTGALVTSSGPAAWEVGGLVGTFVISSASATQATEGITNCTSSAMVRGTGNVGGLVGRIDGSVGNVNVGVAGSRATGQVRIVKDASSGWMGLAGGLVGSMERGRVSRSWASGDVFGTQLLGGLVGMASRSVITGSYAKGGVTAEGENAGGLVGVAEQALIEQSFVAASGKTVSAVAGAGGLVGAVVNGSTLRQTFAAVRVSAGGGGLIASNWTPSVVFTATASFFDKEVAGTSLSLAGSARTSAAMKQTAIYTQAGWDFTSVWKLDVPGSTYPSLR